MQAARRRVVVSALVICAALITTACAAGKHAQTAEESPAIDGVGAGVGSILLREVSIGSPPNGTSYSVGDAAALRIVIVNNGQQPDQLTSVTTPAASGAAVFNSAQAAAGLLGATPSGSVGPSSASVGPPTTTPSGSAASSPSGSSGAFPPVDAPAGGRVSFGINGTDQVIALTGLTSALYPAAAIQITFTFATAGSVTVTVPVQLTASTSPTGLVISDTGTGSSASG
jgi:copper(I)-binding protein